MISWNQVERLRREATNVGRHSISMSIALSVMCSLAAIAIISKKQLTNSLWADLAAFAIPLPIAFHFRRRIKRLGALPYAAALILIFAAAVLFGI